MNKRLEDLNDEELQYLYNKEFNSLKEEEKNVESPSFLSNLARQGYQGATLGFGPKILAAGAALGAKGAGYLGEEATKDIPLPELYKMGLDIERQKLKEGQEKYPVSSFVGQVGASIPTGGTLLKSTGLAGKGLGTAIKGGALLGATEGIGRTNNIADLSQTLSDITQNAGIGAALPIGIAPIGKVVQKGSEFISPIIGGIKKGVSNIFTPVEKRAINLVKSNLATEGLSATEALRQLNDTGLDLVDIVDPRFKAKENAIRFLQDKQTIKDIADTSLQKLENTSANLQKEVANMISNKKIDPENAAEILGRNAKKIVDNQIEARRIASMPLYEKGTQGNIRPDQIVLKNITPEQAINLSLDPNIVNSSAVIGKPINLTAQEFLQSPIVKQAIDVARSQSEKFAQTPAGFIYKDIANPRYTNESLKVLSAADNVLTDMIGNPQLVNQSEVAALKMVKSGLQKLLDEANPTLKKAREIWSTDSKTLKEIENSSIGKIAKLYNTNKTDDLIKRSNDILLLSPERISAIRTQNPQEFDTLLRNSFENRLETIDSETPKAITKAILGKDGGQSLKAALGDNIPVFNGIKKLINTLDTVAARQKLTSGVNFSNDDLVEGTLDKVSKGNLANIITKPALNLYRYIIKGETPEVRRQYTEYFFTPKGRDLLTKLAKTESKKQQSNILETILTDFRNLTPEVTPTQIRPGIATTIGLNTETNE